MSGKWDAVVVGSGIGGLTCGAFLAKAGMKVRVVEQHSQIGGYAHSFSRGPYRFESGIHSAPISNNGLIRFLLKQLGVNDRIETVSHNEMFSGSINGITFTMPEYLDEITETLNSRFPHERENLKALFSDMESLYDAVVGPLFQFEEKGNDKNRSLLQKYQEVSYGSFIAKYISNENLRNIFYAQWPFVGLSPNYSSTAFFSLMYYVHLKEGSNYLKGGFETLASALASAITDRGGRVDTKSAVTRIRIENGLAKSVFLETGEEIESELIVSNISPYILHTQLLDESSRNRLWIKRLSKLNRSVSAVAVYLGLDREISSLIPGNITMWYRQNDFDSIFKRISEGKDTSSDHMIILKTPQASDAQTLFLMSYFNKSHTNDWPNVKEKIADQMIDNAEQLFPGLKSKINCVVTASPTTFERYTGNTDGALYGFENTCVLYGEARMPITTYIPNLYEVGHWYRGCGIWNVMECGYSASRIILQNRMP
jgi:phytoene dehydrogenase-like protein